MGIAYCVIDLGVVVLFGDQMLSLFIDSGENAVITEMGFRYLIINAAIYISLLYVNILRLCIQCMALIRVAMLAGLSEMQARSAVALWVVPETRFNDACLTNPVARLTADLFLFPNCFQFMRFSAGG